MFTKICPRCKQPKQVKLKPRTIRICKSCATKQKYIDNPNFGMRGKKQSKKFAEMVQRVKPWEFSSGHTSKNHTQSAKDKISKSNKGKLAGELNPSRTIDT